MMMALICDTHLPLIKRSKKKMSDLILELPNTFQTPTMAPFCKDEEKYKVGR